jgi:hypothetical protein
MGKSDNGLAGLAMKAVARTFRFSRHDWGLPSCCAEDFRATKGFLAVTVYRKDR